MKTIIVCLFVIILFIWVYQPAFAIVPPPVLINVGVSLLEILSLLFIVSIQFFLVLFCRKKKKEFNVKWCYFLLTVVVLLVFFFLFIRSYGIITERKYEYLTNNMFRLQDDDCCLHDKDPWVFKRMPSDLNCPYFFNTEFPGVFIENIYDNLFSDECVFIDIRKPRAYMACTVKGAVNIPLDTLYDRIEQYKGKKIYLFGNCDKKSYQASIELRKRGYDAYYIVRGVKVFASLGSGFFLYDNNGRDITMLPRFLEKTERKKWDIPDGKLSDDDYCKFDDYIFNIRNIHKLWGRKDIIKKLRKEKTILVDIRDSPPVSQEIFYIPVFKMTPDEIDKKINSLPNNKEIIIMCDDLYTAFEAQWLGCELFRRGYKYSGRYSNPEELFVVEPKIILPFRLTFDRIGQYLLVAYDQFHFYIRHYFYLEPEIHPLYFYAFIAFIIFFRLALSPFSLYSKICKIRFKKRLSYELKDPNLIKLNFFERIIYINSLQNDSVFTKIFCLIPDLAIITVGLLTAFHINDAEIYLAPMVADANKPSIIIAALGAVMFYFYEKRNPYFMDLTDATHKSHYLQKTPFLLSLSFLLIGGISFPAIFTAFLAVNYMVSIVGFQFAEVLSAILDKKDSQGIQHSEITRMDDNCLEAAGDKTIRLIKAGPGLYLIDALSSKMKTGKEIQIDSVSREYIGAKAYNLSIIAAKNIPVPQAFVISREFFDRYPVVEGKLTPSAKEELLKVWDIFSFDKAVVRSSAGSEDGSHKSYAGIFESVPDVDREAFTDGVEQVLSSYTGKKVLVYESRTDDKPVFSGGIIVQQMLRPDYSGVLFTLDPEDPSIISIDIFAGENKKDKFEREKPLRVLVGKRSGEILNIFPDDKRIGDIPLNQLIDTARHLEEIFKNPQDVEWAVENGKFYILQSRNIIYSEPVNNPVLAIEKKRLLNKAVSFNPGEVIWKFNEVSEVLPFPSYAALSLFRKMWEPGSSVSLAYKSFGIPCNCKLEADDILETVMGRLYINQILEKKMLLSEDGTEKLYAALGKFNIETQMKYLYKTTVFRTEKITDGLNRLAGSLNSCAELYTECEKSLEDFLKKHIVQVFRVNIILDYCTKLLENEIKGTDIAINELLDFIPAVSSEPDLRNCGQKSGFSYFTDMSLENYELSDPGCTQQEEILNKLAENYDCINNKYKIGKPDIQKLESYLKNKKFNGAKIKKVVSLLEMISAYSKLKERGRQISACYIALLRKILLKLDEIYHLEGNIFCLTIDEIWSLNSNIIDWDIKALINERSKERECFLPVELPLSLSVTDIEKLGIGTPDRIPAENASQLQGVRVSGNKEIKGIALVAGKLEDAAEAGKNHILIVKSASPGWSVVLPFIGGLVSEGGGMLSHLAILAREYGVPYVAGCTGAVSAIKTGGNIILKPDGTIKL